MGIAYCLVIIRFALEGAFKHSGTSYADSTSGPSTSPGLSGARNNIPMSPIKIDITRQTLSDEANMFGKTEDGDPAQRSYVDV